MGANFDSFPSNCHPELDSGSQDFDIWTSIWRFRNKFGMTGVFCHPELVSGSQGRENHASGGIFGAYLLKSCDSEPFGITF